MNSLVQQHEYNSEILASRKKKEEEMPFIKRLMNTFLGQGHQGWGAHKSHVKPELAKLPCGEEVINALY